MLSLIQLFMMMVFVLLSVAFFSLFERKFMGLIQSRKGPSKVSVVGIIQPIADAVKLIFKTEKSPYSSVSLFYFLSPVVLFYVYLVMWGLLPSTWVLVNFKSSFLILLVVFSISVFGVIYSGWFSNSKYALLGSIRALVQSISYEVGLSTMAVFICVMLGSWSLEDFWMTQSSLNLIGPFLSIFLLLVVTMMAETSRSPFDLSEGESELVSGYNVEYGGLSYTLIFLGENLALLWTCFFIGFIFSSYVSWMLIVLLVWVRASVPRIRFDKMMELFWMKLLPVSLALFSLMLSFLQKNHVF